MMTTAKAITNGYFPFGAVLLNEKIASVFEGDEDGAAFIGHGYTYSGHPVGAAASLACLAETERLQVQTNAGARGAEIFAGLNALKDQYDLVGDVRGGHGLMCAVELVSDPATKKPIDAATITRVQQATYEAGVMVRMSGANLIMSPPLIITAEEAAAIVAALDVGLKAA